MNNERWLLSLTSILFMAIMGLMISIKKPQCIDSKVVEKIDRVSDKKTETIYRCSAFKKVPYSRYFDENLKQIQTRIDSVAIFLRNIDSFQKRVSLVINDDQPLLFKITDHQIEIGSQLLQADGHLERGLAKVWLTENLKNDILTQNLFVEVASDFLLFITQGSLNIQDPLLKTVPELEKIRWPQVLKSKQGYCDSNWKLSEHILACNQIEDNFGLNSEALLFYNLRPLLTSTWIQSYKELSFKKKTRFLKLLPRYLQTQQLSSEKAIEMLLSDKHPLRQGVLNIKKITDLMNSSSLIQDEKEYREFYTKMTYHLQRAGVSDSFAEAYFDYIVEFPEDVSTKSDIFIHLQNVANNHPELQIAIKDSKSIWILPNSTALPLTSFDQIKSQQHVFMACLGLKEIPMQHFFNQAEKLLLIKGCDQKKVYDFEPLVAKGVQAFSFKNKQLAFIQFHLPSFEMKAKELSHIKNFFELVTARDVTKPEFQVLGWSQIQWYEDSLAYKPKAVVDAIELFRAEAASTKSF